MKIEHPAKFVLIFCVTAVAAIVAAAQDGVQTRSIQSNDSALMKQRQTQNSGGTKKLKIVQRVYKYVRTDKNPVSHKPPSITVPKVSKPKITEIGVTMWKLRQPLATEKNLLLLPVLLDDKKTIERWLPERVDTDAVFKVGDRVRFAVETSTPGYLYIIDRETLSNGGFGPPLLIFPASESDDNLVQPGFLFDFPDRNDEWPYLKINPKKASYTGELLTIIISPKPITALTIDKDGYVKNTGFLTDLEFGSNVDILSRKDTADRIYSKPESEGSCGIKTRELRPEKASKSPCGSLSRPLTSAEPQPQSIFRVNGFVGKPAVAFIKLTVSK